MVIVSVLNDSIIRSIFHLEVRESRNLVSIENLYVDSVYIVFNPPRSVPRFKPDLFSLILVLLDLVQLLNRYGRDGYRFIQLPTVIHQSARI